METPLATPSQALQRADGLTVTIRPATGAKDFQVELPHADLTVAALKEAIQAQSGTPLDVQNVSLQGHELTDDMVAKLAEAENPLLEMQFGLHGAGGVEVVTGIPEMINLNILCWKCGLKELPGANDDWCVSNCCCIHEECGPKDLMTTQILCVKFECSVQ